MFYRKGLFKRPPRRKRGPSPFPSFPSPMAIAALSSPGPGRCRRAAAAPPPLPQPGREPAAAAVPAPTSLPFDRRRDLPTPRPLRGGSEPPAGRTGRPAGDASRSPPSPGAASPRREQTGQASRVCSVPVPRRPRPPPPPTPSRVLSLPGPGPLRRDRPHGCQHRRRAEPAPCWDTERGGGGGGRGRPRVASRWQRRFSLRRSGRGCLRRRRSPHPAGGGDV